MSYLGRTATWRASASHTSTSRRRNGTLKHLPSSSFRYISNFIGIYSFWHVARQWFKEHVDNWNQTISRNLKYTCFHTVWPIIFTYVLEKPAGLILYYLISRLRLKCIANIGVTCDNISSLSANTKLLLRAGEWGSWTESFQFDNLCEDRSCYPSPWWQNVKDIWH